MIAQRYKDMLSGKSVIRQISEWSTARGTEIGYENVFDYSLGNPSVPCPEHFTKTCIDLLQTKEPVTLHGYSPTLTIPAVRKAVAESLNRRFGMDYGMEHIFMATGAAGALAHAMRCVAVPVWNHESRVIAALSLSTLTSRVDDAELANFREQLQQAGLALSRALGYPA